METGMIKSSEILTELAPHQQRVVDKAQLENLIIAHGLGSGKTLASIAAADRLGQYTTILTPASLTKNYEKEIKKHTKNFPDHQILSLPTAVSRNIDLPRGTLILDEAHAFRNTGTKRLQYLKKQIQNASRVIALTGTPSYNSLSDIAPLVNLVRGKNTLPESPQDFNNKYTTDVTVNPGWVERNFFGVKPGVVTKLRNKKELLDILSKTVDIHTNNSKDFPSSSTEDIKLDLPKTQQEVYRFVEGNIPRHLRYKIRSNLPTSKQEAKALNSFVVGVRQASNSTAPYQHSFDPDTAKETALKLRTAVDKIMEGRQKDPNFKALAYSNFMDAGLNPMAKMLDKEHVPYAMYHGGLSAKEKADIVDRYNKNKLSVILGSSSASEGLDLKGTKLIQILEPHFNEAKIRQIMGRGIRYKSHSDLPENERHVNIQRFYSRPSDDRSYFDKALNVPKDVGVDRYLKDNADSKESIIQEVLRSLEEKQRQDR